MEFTTRAGRPDDAELLAGFNQAMAVETEGKLLDGEIAAAGVRAALERPENGNYLIAEHDGTPVGSLMVTTEWSDWRNGFFWWVQSVYVVPEFRKQGVYRSLYAHVRIHAKSQPDVCGIRLYVENENLGAQKTYERLGMEQTGYRLYEDIL
jgi:ribosomal protein S18 acetylase RimI-like enzyme